MLAVLADLNLAPNRACRSWSPQLDVKSVCLSLLSMLSSAKKKKRPPDNDSTVVMSQGQIRAVHSRSEKVARIHVLPRWVDATGDKVATSLKTPLAQPSAPIPGQPQAVPGPAGPTTRSAARPTGDLRHADWLFVPVADTPAQQNTPGSSPPATGSAAGSTPVVVGEDGNGSAAPQPDGSAGSLQEQYTGKR